MSSTQQWHARYYSWQVINKQICSIFINNCSTACIAYTTVYMKGNWQSVKMLDVGYPTTLRKNISKKFLKNKRKTFPNNSGQWNASRAWVRRENCCPLTRTVKEKSKRHARTGSSICGRDLRSYIALCWTAHSVFGSVSLFSLGYTGTSSNPRSF